jgi:hypothetical protein
VPKAANASQSGVVKPLSIFMPSHSVRSKAEPAAALRLRQSFIFFDTQTLKCFYKLESFGFKNCRHRRKYFYTLK